MANLDRPFGFEVWDELIRSNLYAVVTLPTIGIYHNDIVRHGGAHLSTKKGYLPIIEDSAVPDGHPGLLGSVLAIFDEDMDPVSRIIPDEAGDDVVAGYVMVADSPDQFFVVQEDSVANAITLTEGGQNVDLISVAICAGNATTGISTQELDSSTTVNTVLQLKIVRPHPEDTPTEDHCRYIVQINEHYYGDTIAGIAD